MTTTNKVTLKDVYEVVNRLEDKVDRVHTEMRNDIDELQSFKSKALGIAGIIGGAASLLGSWLLKQITRT